MNFTDISKTEKQTFRITKPGAHVFFVYNTSARVDVDIQTKDAQVYIYGLYLGKDNVSYELFTTQHHAVGNSTSNLLIKGAFFDTSKFTYEGLIRIDKNAQKSHAYQKNQNIIMSDGAVVDSRPFLEILANDVFCTHGSTTGRLDKNQLYYLVSRGVQKKEAETLLLHGFLHDIFGKIESVGIRKNEIEEYKKKVEIILKS